jgi:hypothetical protein
MMCMHKTFLAVRNEILQTGVFPDRLKYVIVRPIFKKGDKHETSNYRPVSLLTLPFGSNVE